MVDLHQKQFPRSSRHFAPLVVVVLGVLPASAHASLWGEENGPLYTIVSQMAAEIAQAAETLGQLKATYDETKRYVGYADDAVRAFKDFQSFGEDVLQAPQAAVDQLFPDLQYFRAEPSNTGPWAQGTGELQRMIRYCLGSTVARGCAEFRDAVTAKQARAALEQTFGTTAASNLEVNAADYEASVAMASASAQLGRNAVTKEQAAALMRRCTEGNGDGAAAACQAAAHAASILQMQQLAGISDSLAEANRLQAVEVAQQNAERKRELNEALERRKAVLAGTKRLAPTQVELRTEGLSFFEGGGR
jgi:hypothetical protein